MRKRVLEKGDTEGKTLKGEVLEKIGNEVNNLVAMYSPEGYTEPEYEKIALAFNEIVPFNDASQYQLKTQILKLKTTGEITEFLMKVVTDLYERREKAYGEDASRQLERFVCLSTMDNLWIDHLTAVDDLRDGIGLRGYAQKDPLVEYKKEAFDMFEKLINQIDYEVVRKVFRVQVLAQPPVVSTLQKAREERGKIAEPAAATENTPRQPLKKGDLSAFANAMGNLPTDGITHQQTEIHVAKIGRNDPCWCGSGKKWKKCHYPQTE